MAREAKKKRDEQDEEEEETQAIHAIPRVRLWKRGIWRLGEGFWKKKDISESICRSLPGSGVSLKC